MKSEYIAKILSSKKDGKRTIGTGYPIAKDLVLTARHVVIFPERNESKPIVIEWTDYNYSDDNVTEIVFDGGKECDIAILRCKIPPQVQISFSILARRFPIEHETWAGFGYPQIGKDEEAGTRKIISVLGKFHPPIATSHEITLTSESDALEKEGWRGVSGAPVFQGATLYAVIIQTPKKRKECFTAVSIPYLLKHNEKFREAIKPPIDEKIIKEQTKKLHEEIKTNIEILLESNFDLKDLRISLRLPNNEETSYSYIAEYLTKQSTRESIGTLIRILNKNSPKNTDDMQEIAGWLLLNSVDPIWWFENEPRMQEAIAEFNLKVPEYFETIISRHASQPARYTLNFNNTDKSKQSPQEKPYPKPYKEENREKKKILVLDANENATDEQLLISIYKDLWHKNQDTKDDDIKFSPKELLELIIESADGDRIINEGKLVYYLVEKHYLDLLKSKSWFHENEQMLTSCLRFICCNIDKPDNQEKPCAEGEGFVLSELAKLLQIIEPVKQNEQSQI
jgi:hypothetical protein